MKTVYRYVRAFILALKMTLRGEKPPQPVQHPLVMWAQQAAVLIDALYRAVEQNGFDLERRKKISLRLDGRQMSLETVLAGMKFQVTQEYISLLRSGTHTRTLNAIYANNMNQRYWVSSLAELDSLQNPTIQAAIERLKQHLEQIPSA